MERHFTVPVSSKKISAFLLHGISICVSIMIMIIIMIKIPLATLWYQNSEADSITYTGTSSFIC